MKKILILGGGYNQLGLIKSAKGIGLEVILCDFTTTNQGIVLADKHYQVDYTDREKVLEIAIKENIDGVISNSEYAMENVAYISEKLNLIGNKLNDIKKISSKNGCRELLKKAGLYTPKYFTTSSLEQTISIINSFEEAFYVKPNVSSGSRGGKRFDRGTDIKEFSAIWNDCYKYSLDKKVIVEEYVKMPSLSIIEGDVFVLGDQFLWNGWFHNIRSPFNSTVPMTYELPLSLDDKKIQCINDTIKKLFTIANIRFGEFNIELYFTEEGKVFIIEVNVRQGGFQIPEMIEASTGIDMNRLLVSCAVKDNQYFAQVRKKVYKPKYITKHMVYSRKDGILKEVLVDAKLKENLIEFELLQNIGNTVKECYNTDDAIAKTLFQFDTLEQQKKYTKRYEDLIVPVLE